MITHRVGLNVPEEGTFPVDLLQTALPFGGWVRIPLTPERNLQEYFKALKEAGFRILGALVNQSFWLSNGTRMYDEDALNHYARSYGHLLDAVQVGNEWDHVSPSSWTLDQPILNVLLDTVWRARLAWGQSWQIVLGGAVHGQPDLLRGVRLDLVDAIAVHPYGQRPEQNWPDPNWGHGVMLDLTDRYAQVVREELGADRPIWLTEVGIEAHASEHEGFKAEYLTRLVDVWTTHRVNQGPIILFTAHDYAGFGIVGKPAGLALKNLITTRFKVEQDMAAEPRFVLGFADKAAELGDAVVGRPLENQDYLPLASGGEVAFQTTEQGVLFYSKKANKAHFLRGR